MSCIRRSATLGTDPKMREMAHFLESHCHEERLRQLADFRLNDRSDGPPRSPRSVAAVCREVTAAEDHDPTYVHGTDGVQDRLDWRTKIDRKLRRLMQDTTLDLGSGIQPVEQHNLRCSHLDRTYDWYTKHGMKEARKEKEAPRYIKFDPNGPTLAGSLRRPPPKHQKKPAPVVPLERAGRAPPALPCLLGAGSSGDVVPSEPGSPQDSPLATIAEAEPKPATPAKPKTPFTRKSASSSRITPLSRWNV